MSVELEGVIIKMITKPRENGWVKFNFIVTTSFANSTNISASFASTTYIIHGVIKYNLVGWTIKIKCDIDSSYNCNYKLTSIFDIKVPTKEYIKKYLYQLQLPVKTINTIVKTYDPSIFTTDTIDEAKLIIIKDYKYNINNILHKEYLTKKYKATPYECDSIKFIMDSKNISLSKLEINPYSLIKCNIGWKKIKAISGVFKVNPQLKQQAKIIKTIKKHIKSGNSCIDQNEFKYTDIEQYINIPDGINNYYIVENEIIITKKLYDAEIYISNKLLEIDAISDKSKVELSLSFDLDQKIILNTEQLSVINSVIKHNITIITGGPGTGKSTLIKYLVKSLISLQYQILTPTGKAAKNIISKGDIDENYISTIHKYIYTHHSVSSPNILFIIDEMSMVPIMLLCKLLKTIHESSKIVFIGDVNQLPSIKSGQVLKDLIESHKFSTIKLIINYRQNNSTIINNALKILEHDDNLIEDDTFIIFPYNNLSYLFKLDYDFTSQNVQIITPMKKTCDTINSIIQNGTNDNNELISIYNKSYKINDKIIQIVNDYTNEVFNGSIGYIDHIENNKVSTNFENNIFTNKLSNFDLAYAITIHKSQGSEYDTVIIVLSDQFMLDVNLFYTAVTRAKNNVLILAREGLIKKAVTTIRPERKTMLLFRLISSN